MPFRKEALVSGLAMATGLLAWGCATSGPKQLAWDTLPFPRNSNWTGPQGSTATIEGADLVLQGQMVRTHQTYTKPLVVECQVEVESRAASDGYFAIEFLPEDAPRDVTPTHFRSFQIIYRNPGAYSGRDGLAVFGRDDSSGNKMLWGEEPFSVVAGQPCSIRLEISADHVRAVVNGKTYDLKAVQIPYDRFYIQLEAWQPLNRWHVKQFSLQ